MAKSFRSGARSPSNSLKQHEKDRLAAKRSAPDWQVGHRALTLAQLFGSRTAVAQWGMTPVINATALRLLRIAYRRAFGSPEMPDPEFLAGLAHELKNQLPSNVDQHDESELF